MSLATLMSLTTLMWWATVTVADGLNVVRAHDLDVVGHRGGG